MYGIWYQVQWNPNIIFLDYGHFLNKNLESKQWGKQVVFFLYNIFMSENVH